jgi:hypothetical protein
MRGLSNQRVDNGIYSALCAFGSLVLGSILIGWAFLIFFPLWLVVPFLGFGFGALLTTAKPLWSVMLGILCGLVGVGVAAFFVMSQI